VRGSTSARRPAKIAGEAMIWNTTRSAEPHDGPTFSISGVTLRLRDQSRAHIQQTPFRWVDGAWDGTLHLSRAGSAPTAAQGILRLTPAVWDWWTKHGVNAPAESAKQLALEIHTREWSTDLGVVTLQMTETRTVVEPPRIRLSPQSA
jgi:hypothetical protein